ncbi:M50 family metallopeptidase [Sphingomonas sp. ASV193]|uniref:M50 family metallopeptidase n=1 Tax=Sphingomonas sp. ASV193 TaxID=3144405 RepID=UPI0032E8A2DE
MLAQPPLWLIVIAFMLAIGPLVFFHELGHYAMARAFGIGAESFSIGFGREIVGWTDRRGTRWKVGLLPLGGYVKFVGDENAASQPGAGAAADPRSFHARPVWQRFLVVLAGPMTNFLIAILIFAAFFAAIGVPRTPPVVAQMMPGSAAASSGLAVGDRITAIGGEGITTFEDIFRYVVLRPGQTVTVDAVRDGRAIHVPVTLGAATEVDEYGQRYRVGRLGILQPKRVSERVPAIDLIPTSVGFTLKMTRAMVDGLGQVIAGQRSVKELGGPLKMAQVAGQQAALGPFEFIQLLAFFSINLGFINLLPVPMLDGGHLAFYAIEAVRRKPVDPRAMDWAFRGGLALLLALMLVLTVNDLSSFGLFDRLGRLIG